jgi:hypothetical protein
MLIPLGFLAGSGGGVDTDFELIETQILGSSTPSITFTGLGTYSSTYKHLQIRVSASHDQAGGNGIFMRVNGDTGSSYSYHELGGNASSVFSGAASGQTNIQVVVGLRQSLSNNAFGAAVIDILDAYSTTKNKTVRSLSGQPSTDSLILLSSGAWLNTASITSITLGMLTGNISTKSRFSIYGLKG